MILGKPSSGNESIGGDSCDDQEEINRPGIEMGTPPTRPSAAGPNQQTITGAPSRLSFPVAPPGGGTSDFVRPPKLAGSGLAGSETKAARDCPGSVLMANECCGDRKKHRVLETRTANEVVRRRWECREHRKRWTTYSRPTASQKPDELTGILRLHRRGGKHE